MIENLTHAALIGVALYCFSMWIVYAIAAYRTRNTLPGSDQQKIADFIYRVGLVGTIAAAVLYLGS